MYINFENNFVPKPNFLYEKIKSDDVSILLMINQYTVKN